MGRPSRERDSSFVSFMAFRGCWPRLLGMGQETEQGDGEGRPAGGGPAQTDSTLVESTLLVGDVLECKNSELPVLGHGVVGLHSLPAANEVIERDGSCFVVAG